MNLHGGRLFRAMTTLLRLVSILMALSCGVLFAGPAQEPIIVFEFGYISVRLDGGRLAFNERLKPVWQTVPGVAQRFMLDGKVWDITTKDLEEGKAFVKAKSIFSRTRVANETLYLDGAPVDIGPENKVLFVTEAVPWGKGILCLGRTIPRKAAGLFTGITRNLEPWCAIYIDPSTHRGSDLWISGKVQRVFPASVRDRLA